MNIAATSTGTRRAARTARAHAVRTADGPRSAKLVSGRLETLVLFTIAILLLAGAAFSAQPPTATPEMSSLTVQSGDSLWTLAEAHPVEGLNTAQVAELISKANQREKAFLVSGESILVPVGATDDRVAIK